MNAEWKEKWLKALRSGKYKQTHFALYNITPENGGFCCLGVLCDIYDPYRWIAVPGLQTRRGYIASTACGYVDSNLPEDIFRETELSETETKKLISLNDRTYDEFQEVIEYIEKNL